MVTAKKSAAPSADRPPSLWVSSTYFAEGLPYMVVNELAVPLFKHLGASLGTIGLTALFHLPWNVKFLWGHLVDGYETKRRWILAVEAVLVVALIALAMVANRAEMIGAISVALLVIATLSATHDIAVDGFYLEALDEEGQSKYVGLRAMAYRLAMIGVAGPGLVVISRFGWTACLSAIAVISAGLWLLHLFVLPTPERRQLPATRLVAQMFGVRWLIGTAAIALTIVLVREVSSQPWFVDLRQRSPVSLSQGISLSLLGALTIVVALRSVIRRRVMASSSHFARSFQSFASQPRVGFILAFIVTYRVGESLLIKMKLPFLLDEVGMTLGIYGIANGTVGLIASIAGALLGGWLISKHGLRRWIWPMVLAQNLLNLLYVGLAYAAGSGIDLTLATVVIALERVGEGLGTAVFMVYLMRCCSPKHKAAHMAIATALMSVGYTIAGTVSGSIAELTGFRLYFLLSFFATIPAMLIIVYLPHLDRREDADDPPTSS